MVRKIVAIAALSLGLYGSAQAQFVNPGFETGDLTGWSATGDVSVVTSFAGISAPEGKYMALLGSTDPDAINFNVLLQSMSETQQPAVLWYRQLGTGSVEVQYGSTTFPGATVATLSGSTVTYDSGWKQFALGKSTNYIGFFHDATAGGTHVLVDIAPVPEPGTYALLLAGLGIMGTVARRRARADQA